MSILATIRGMFGSASQQAASSYNPAEMDLQRLIVRSQEIGAAIDLLRQERAALQAIITSKRGS